MVQGNPQFEEEILFYYNNNWRLFRQAAYEKDLISSYDPIKTPADSPGIFNMVLITKYPDSTAFKMAEENFRPIMIEFRTNGPVLPNEIPGDSMLSPGSVYEGISIPQARNAGVSKPCAWIGDVPSQPKLPSEPRNKRAYYLRNIF